MKKLLLLLTMFFISCSSSDDTTDCNCQKLTYEVTTELVNTGGTVRTVINEELISTENVVCQEEQTDVAEGDNRQFDIECDG